MRSTNTWPASDFKFNQQQSSNTTKYISISVAIRLEDLQRAKERLAVNGWKHQTVSYSLPLLPSLDNRTDHTGKSGDRQQLTIIIMCYSNRAPVVISIIHIWTVPSNVVSDGTHVCMYHQVSTNVCSYTREIDATSWERTALLVDNNNNNGEYSISKFPMSISDLNHHRSWHWLKSSIILNHLNN